MRSDNTRWTCPCCERSFGRANRPHTCVPALSLEAYLAARTPAQRRVFEAVAPLLSELDDVAVEAVSVGILIKRSRTFAELRPRREGFVLTLLLPHRLNHPRIGRTLAVGSARTAHAVHLRDAGEVDEEVKGWLAEAYLAANG